MTLLWSSPSPAHSRSSPSRATALVAGAIMPTWRRPAVPANRSRGGATSSKRRP